MLLNFSLVGRLAIAHNKVACVTFTWNYFDRIITRCDPISGVAQYLALMRNDPPSSQHVNLWHSIKIIGSFNTQLSGRDEALLATYPGLT
jgi:hypothetical protein